MPSLHLQPDYAISPSPDSGGHVITLPIAFVIDAIAMNQTLLRMLLLCQLTKQILCY